MCINLDNFITVTNDAHLWIYNSRRDFVEAYSNVVISKSCKLPDYTVAVFDHKYRQVSNKELDTWSRAGYYLVWSTENDNEKAIEEIYYSVNRDMNKKIQKCKNEIKEYESIKKNILLRKLTYGIWNME